MEIDVLRPVGTSIAYELLRLVFQNCRLLVSSTTVLAAWNSRVGVGADQSQADDRAGLDDLLHTFGHFIADVSDGVTMDHHATFLQQRHGHSSGRR